MNGNKGRTPKQKDLIEATIEGDGECAMLGCYWIWTTEMADGLTLTFSSAFQVQQASTLSAWLRMTLGDQSARGKILHVIWWSVLADSAGSISRKVCDELLVFFSFLFKVDSPST